MKNLLRHYAVGCVAIAVSLSMPIEAVQAQWLGTWATYPRTFNIYWGQPAACDAPAKAAATTWNSAGSRFTYADAGIITTSVHTSNSTSATTLDYGPPPAGYEDASAWTPLGYVDPSLPPSSARRIKDSDVIINGNRWSEMYCGSVPAFNQIDFQSVVFHELGHAWVRRMTTMST